jgi:hypothetical protein
LTMDIINKHFIFNVIYREDWLRADLLLWYFYVIACTLSIKKWVFFVK